MLKSLKIKLMMRAMWYALTHAMRRMWSRLFCLTAALALAGTVSATDVTFNGQTISYTNAETNWVDGELVLIYTNTLTDGSLTLPAYTKARLLIVAGGGAGGSPGDATRTKGGAGGGGAGGFITKDSELLEKGTYTLSVGAGGAAGSENVQTAGTDGNDSYLQINSGDVYRAVGGGGGAVSTAIDGRKGGSGGGSSLDGNGGAGNAEQGKDGGAIEARAAGAGGGGAGEKGGTSETNNQGGNGGAGKESNITGESVIYAGGGGGGSRTGTGGAGGAGGGGNGANDGENGAPGTDGLGGGGGGGSQDMAGGKGGDGVIIIRLLQVMPEKPATSQSIPYDGEEHTILEENAAYTVSGDVKASARGTYTATVTLNDGYCWADGSKDTVTINWIIEKINLVIKSLTVEGWQIGGIASEPVIETEPAIEQEKLSVTYQWSNAGRKPWKPTDGPCSWEKIVEELEENGARSYYVQSIIVSTEEYNVDGGAVTNKSNEFEIWNAPELQGMNLGYRLPFTGEGTVTLSLSESAIEGFSYSQFEDGGTDIRAIDSGGNQLKCRVASWNTSGTSEVVVELGSLSSASLCWGRLVDENDTQLEIPTRSESKATASSTATITSKPRIVKDARFWNAWTKTPEWDDYATSAADMASAMYGDVYYVVTGSTGTFTNTPPKKAGSYTIQFFVDSTNDNYKAWMGLKSGPIEKDIIPHSPYTDLKGTAESATQAGRVLLVNDDTRAPAVSGQAYDNTDTTKATYWEHTDELAFSIRADNLKLPRNHRLMASSAIDELCGATTIWTLQNVRIGNLYNSEYSTSRIYLPYSSTSADSPAGAMHLVLRNLDGAAIISPCYSNGVGTVYFDAVNSETVNAADGYKLVVEKITGEAATNAVAALDTSLWETVSVLSLPVVNGELPTSLTNELGEALYETNEVALTVSTGGSDKNFYRICAKINERGLVRFRIRRTGLASNYQSIETGRDDGGFILVDNILVSYPAMRADMAPYGDLDTTLTGKAVAGCGGAMSVPFPSVTSSEVRGRGRVKYTTNVATNAATVDFVSTAKMQYRWRYLDQLTNDWKETYINTDTLVTTDPLDLTAPNGEMLPGDIEFRYLLTLNAPFYSYVDYSGLDIKLNSLYSEEIYSVTNTLGSSTLLESRGTDWFCRLREGASDYASVQVGYFIGTETNEQFAALDVIGSGLWRGFVSVSTNYAGKTLSYRLILRDKQTAGGSAWETNTNILYSATATSEFPISSVLTAGDTNSWSAFTLDGATGGYIFQIDESTKALTVAHADYQNFNGWTDATSPYFKGTSETNDYKVGTASSKRYYAEDFAGWHTMEGTHKNWLFTESYVTNLDQMVSQYTSFDEGNLGEWLIKSGMWVAKQYADPASGVALQMEGQGFGALTYETTSYAPRGLKSISFNARLGQAIDISSFSHVRDGSTLSNYTFAVAGSYQPLGESASHRGNASLSAIAYYQQYVGAYEVRWEQIREKAWALSLYRWKENSIGQSESTLLKAWTNTTEWATTDKRQPLLISVRTDKDATWLHIAARQDGMGDGESVGRFIANANNWQGFVYKDEDSNRLRSGEYGVFSANCNAEFAQMAYWESSTTMGGDDVNWTGPADPAFRSASTPVSVTPGQASWAFKGGSLAYTNGLVQASIAPQKFSIYTRKVGEGNWNTNAVWTTNLTSFGATRFEVPLYTTDTCQIKFKVDSGRYDPRVDIVLDTIEFAQWAGNSWTDTTGINGHGSSDIPNYTRYGETNFVFTHAWIATNVTDSLVTTGILLSAKRTAADGCASIRSPLMDGRSGRGLGLGMLSFGYAGAQENANLLLQIATNDVSTTDFDTFSGWETVTNFSFAAMTATERAGGRLNYYFGLHGVVGAMRIVVDTNTIAQVASVTDPDKFGEVFITDIACYDEPALDERSWWGWNLRMISKNNSGAENDATNDTMRVFLSDSAAGGQSLALNNSTTLDTLPQDAANYEQNKPFVQTPTFATNYIGEISFKARKYSYSTNETMNAQPASVVLYGAKTGSSPLWTKLSDFVISNETYATFKYVTNPGEDYATFRLAVSGADGVTNERGDVVPEDYDKAVRVLLDEVLVSEAVRPRMGFRNVGAFRSNLSTANWVPNVPSASEQPLCDESWGVQCEVYGAQLMENIDFDRDIKVKFYWYKGSSPWGFENWRTNSAAQSAYLAPAADSNLVFRSSYETAGDAVVPPSTSFEVVQYALEVTWYQKEDATNPEASEVLQTNILSAADWSTPSWYRPIDYNAQNNSGFAAYTILDKVAPGWAWINEINIFGGWDDSWANKDVQGQFIELAIPSNADLTDWKLQLLEAQSSSAFIITNTLVQFGYNGAPTSKGTTYVQSNMTFYVVGSPLAQANGYLSRDNGTLDAVWRAPTTATESMGRTGEISAGYPVGLQLVRKSGIVENEFVVMGTNIWEGSSSYNPTTKVELLNKYLPNANFFYLGEDAMASAVSKPILNVTSSGYSGSGASLSVLKGNGGENDTVTSAGITNMWSNTVRATPGRINEGQEIDPDAIPTPNGESIVIYANLDITLGHIQQRFGDASDFTNASQIVYMKKGSALGTNITYQVDNWYELASVTTNGTAITPTSLGERQYTVNVGRGVSNNVTVVATAQVAENLRNLGLGPDNPYSEAVIDWLEKGTDVYGNKWPNGDSGEINLAEYHSLNGTYITNMTLTTMYWLDMDPTTNGLWFVGGVSQAPVEHKITSTTKEGNVNVLTNLRVGVELYMTNTETTANWSPYVLRGITPGSHTLDYSLNSENWTSATFKVTGYLNNEHGKFYDYTCWVPLRWFVFGENSFDENHQSFIEITDPFSTSSPAADGVDGGWAGWAKKYPDTNWRGQAYYFWSIDSRLKPRPVEMLQKENYYNWDSEP